MLFSATYKQFSFEEFNSFIWALWDKHWFRRIRFEPEPDLPLFTEQLRTHAAPNRDISQPDGFIGQWAKHEATVRHIKFRFTGQNGNPDIEMFVDLDNRIISLDSASGITPQEVKDILYSSISSVSDIKEPKISKKPERDQGRYDGYKIIESFPESGQAWTHIATKEGEGDERHYVLKVLKNTSDQRRKRFEREIEACLLLSHPNIVKVVYHKLDATPRPFLVSEYCEGGALDSSKISELNLLQKLEMFGKVCSAVGFAHKNGVIHRDLKPENIFLKSDKLTPVVGDFGLCLMIDDDRITRQSEAIGPRYYMAPELEDGRYEGVSPASDVYSLGKILYWLLTGNVFAREKHRRAPFDLTADSQNPEIFMIYEAIDGMIVEEPAKRKFQDGGAVAEVVSSIIRRLAMGANAIGLNVPQRCIYCGNGVYRPIYSNYLTTTKFTSAHDFGIQLVNERDRRWLYLACDKCGNIQMFRPDLASDPNIWK